MTNRFPLLVGEVHERAQTRFRSDKKDLRENKAKSITYGRSAVTRCALVLLPETYARRLGLEGDELVTELAAVATELANGARVRGAFAYLEAAAAHVTDRSSLVYWTLKNNAAVLALRAGDVDDAQSRFAAVAAAAGRLPSSRDQQELTAIALLHYGQVRKERRHYRAAERTFLRAREYLKDSELSFLAGRIEHELGFLAFLAGDYAGAEREFAEALRLKSISRADPCSLGATHHMLGRARLLGGRIEEAIPALECALERSREGGDLRGQQEVFNVLAHLAHARGFGERALALISAGLELHVPDPKLVAWAQLLFLRAQIRLERAEHESDSARLENIAAAHHDLQALIHSVERSGVSTGLAGVFVDAHLAMLTSQLSMDDTEAKRWLKATRRAIRISASRGDRTAVELRSLLDRFDDPEARYGVRAEVAVKRAFPGLLLVDEGQLAPDLLTNVTIAVRTASELVREVRRWIPSLPELHVAVLASERRAARVALLREAAVVGIQLGFIAELKRLLDNLMNQPEVLRWFGLESLLGKRIAAVTDSGFHIYERGDARLDPIRGMVRDLLFRLSVRYLISHEVAHLIYGHVSLKAAGRASNRELHALEMDADAFAVTQTLRALLGSVRSGAVLPNIASTPDAALRTWSLAIYLVLRSMGPFIPVVDDAFAQSHPHPLDRFMLATRLAEVHVKPLAAGPFRALACMVDVATTVERTLGSPGWFDPMHVPREVHRFEAYLTEVRAAWRTIRPALVGVAYRRPADP